MITKTLALLCAASADALRLCLDSASQLDPSTDAPSVTTLPAPDAYAVAFGDGGVPVCA